MDFSTISDEKIGKSLVSSVITCSFDRANYPTCYRVRDSWHSPKSISCLGIKIRAERLAETIALTTVIALYDIDIIIF